MRTQFAVLNRVAKEYRTENDHFKQRLKGSEGVNNRGNLFQSRKTSTETELRENSVCPRKQKVNQCG